MRKITIGNYEIPKYIADRFRALIRDLGFHEVSVKEEKICTASVLLGLIQTFSFKKRDV